VALMLEHLGLAEEAERVSAAVAEDIASRGTAARPTAAVGDAIAELVARQTSLSRN